MGTHWAPRVYKHGEGKAGREGDVTGAGGRTFPLALFSRRGERREEGAFLGGGIVEGGPVVVFATARLFDWGFSVFRL